MFEVRKPPLKVFPMKFWVCHTRLYNCFSIPQIFLHKMPSFYQSAKVFSLKKFLLYGITMCIVHMYM